MKRAANAAAATLVALAVWQGLIIATGVPRFILPGPAPWPKPSGPAEH